MFSSYAVLLGRLLLACVLGGIIGYEREQTHRPAGFRTHILVCVGSALVMITSEFIFKKYAGHTNIDPARLGAQVISGIGFIGAGTIMREGFSVKGLTTAASLWAVSCVGLAVGIGFYEGALGATALIFLTLIFLKRFELFFSKKNNLRTLYIESYNIPGQLGFISEVMERYDVFTKKIEFINSEDEKNLLVKLLIKLPDLKFRGNLFHDLHGIAGIQKVYEE